MKLSIRNLCFSLGVSALALIPACLAATLCEAMDSYKKKDYQTASKLFEKSIKENPKDWKAHYYMGNCLYAMGKFNSAAYQYNLAAAMTRNPHQKHQCEMAAYKSEMTQINMRVAQVNMNHSINRETESKEAQLAQRKNQIMAQAERHAAQVQKQAAERLQAERANSQARGLDANGNIVFDIPTEHAQRVHNEAEGHAQYIKDLAKNKADNLL